MKLLHPSFRLRIAFLSAAISGAVLLGFGLLAWNRLRQERLHALDREIRALAYRHPGWLNQRANFERLGAAIEFIYGEDRKTQLILLAADQEGSVRFRSAHWPEEIRLASFDLSLDREADKASPPAPPRGEPSNTAMEGFEPSEPQPGGPPGWRRGQGPGPGGPHSGGLFTRKPRFFSQSTSTTSWRFGILGNEQNRLVIGLDQSELEAELARLRGGFLIALPFALAAIALGGWLVAGLAVRPLRDIARTAEQVTARGLDQRLPIASDDPEIRRLVSVLNRMMDRLEKSFHQATRFSADASHELKTPLAVMQGELEQALQAAPPDSREQRMYASLLEETQRLKTITRGLLLLAQADSGRLVLAPEPLRLSDELEDLCSDVQVLAEDRGVALQTRFQQGITVSADRVLLRLALSNLLENAIHYNDRGGWVRVDLEATNQAVEVTVTNTGPGIPSQERSHVFDRFHRGAGARDRRRDGLGLGLSLAREIAVAHRGDLTLIESTPGPTTFRLSLPVIPAASAAGPQPTE